MMRLQELLTDDEAVSPVIGVILMVAITVILAAVIASFVLGLGQQQETAPQASFSVEYDNSTNPAPYDGNLTVTHDSGDSIVEEELFFRGEDFHNASDSWAAYNSSGLATGSGTSGGQPAVVAGDRADFGANTTYELRVVWESSEGGSSNTFITDDGPDA